jgi:outer membrane protein
MKKLIVLALAMVCLSSGAAMADSIAGRLGVTGRIGLIAPADSTSEYGHNSTDTGFLGGAGLIYGIDNHFAADLEVTRASFGSQDGDFGVTDVSLGGQYRFQPRYRLVPYLGAGMDILVSDYSPYDGSSRDVDSTVGFNLRGGIDYFLQKQLAVTAEAKMLVAPDASITDRFGERTGHFDPTCFSSTVGVRFFFN